MDPLSMLGGYGVFAVLGYLLLKDAGGYLLRRFLPAADPAAPHAPPAIPADPTAPTAPSQHPILDAVMRKVFGGKAVPASRTDTGFLAAMKAELETLVPTPPAK